MKKHSLTVKFALPLALGVVLALASSCSKQEKTETDHSDMKMPEAQSAPAPTPTVLSEIKPAAQPLKAAVLLPLPAEIMAMVASNRTASAYEQIYYITNSSITEVQKAQALMLMLPSFGRDDQRAVAHAAVNYVEDSTYALISAPLLEGKLNPQILSVFMTDILKRSEAIKIPILTSIAHTKNHPLQGEAQDLLVAFSKPQVQQQASNKMD
jgi:hypothetical protein